MEKVNSKEYWDERFVSGDWDHYDGDLQSAFFSQIALDAFPAWLDRELARHEWTVFDVGCAEGGGTATLARRFPSCHTIGIDVSEAAMKQAEKKYPFCRFLQGDVYTQKETADVIFVSNVLEHLQSPAENMRSLVELAKCHAILIHPLHDTLDIAEHFHMFDEEFFPLRIGDHVLSHFKIIDCERRNSPYWPGEQILVVYSRESVLPEDRRLSDLFDDSEYRALKQEKAAALAELQEKLEQQVAAAEAERNAHREALDEMVKSGSEAVSHLKHQLTKQEEQTLALQQQLTEQAEQVVSLQRQLTERNEQASALQRQLTESSEQMKTLQKDVEARKEELLRTDSEKRSLQKKLERSEKRNADALRQLDDMTRSRLFKLVHLFNRILHQGFHKDKAERRKFRKWIMGWFRHIPNMDHRYNPLFSVISLLTGQNEVLDGQEVSDMSAEDEQVKLPEQVCACIDEDYVKYDVIVFRSSIIISVTSGLSRSQIILPEKAIGCSISMPTSVQAASRSSQRSRTAFGR
ncbi:MAG: methyltransferase domain-containing protein [Intestinimonas sp.]